MGSTDGWRVLLADQMLEQPQTERKELCSPPVGEEAEVADAHETAR